MRLDSIPNISQVTVAAQPTTTPQTSNTSFGDTLNQALGQVNDLQVQADSMAQNVATGEVDKIHEAMIAMEKASLALELTVQVRNKAIEAYQELMRTQV
jgi:flagellar hook-basal body complex protein FliE